MSMSSFDAKAFVLSEQESTKIFKRDIIPAEFGGFVDKNAAAPLLPLSPPLSGGWKSEPPVAVLIVGQTGAGKTHAAPAIKGVFESIVRGRGEPRVGREETEDLGSRNEKDDEEQAGPVIAHFIADTYKTYHPAYANLSAGDANEQTGRASAATGPDARRWLAMAVRHAVALRLDVLLESACRHPEDFAHLAQAFRGGGYRVEVGLMAVPAGLSRLGILTRFYHRRSLEEAGPKSSSPRRGSLLTARLTPKKVHDDSYEGLLRAAEFIDESDAIDQVVVVRRGNLVAYANERQEDGAWKQQQQPGAPGGAADALRRERQRPLLETERAAAAEDLFHLSRMESGSSSDLVAQIAGVKTLLELQLTETAMANHEGFPEVRPLILPSKTGLLPDEDGICVDLKLGTCVYQR